MSRQRPPGPALRPYVETLWISEDGEAPRAARERVLPTGRMHLVLRLAEEPLRVFRDEADPHGESFPHAVVGGARAGFYVRDVSRPQPAVGAMLRPGAGALLLGVPAHELAERHTALEDLWGADAERARSRVLEAEGATARLDRFEEILRERIVPRGQHPAVAHALGRFAEGAAVGPVVAASGYSHRRFIALFRSAVGLTPKAYARVLRFRRALLGAAEGGGASWAELALDSGYSDQAHFNRDFRAFAGVTPGEYRSLDPAEPHHVPLVRGGQIPSRPGRRGPAC
jgi:AraC-like DNA-binding protein